MRTRSLWLSKLLLVVVLVLSALLGSQKVRGLDEPVASPWLDAASPQLDKIADLPAGQLPPNSVDGNRDCESREVVTRPASLLFSKQSSTGCMVDTAFGSVATSGYVERTGTGVAGPTTLPSGANFNLIPIPFSTTALNLYNGPAYGSYARFIRNLDTGLSTQTQVDGTVSHTITSPVESAISDSEQNKIPVDYSSISFSPDGQWMVTDAPSIGAIRVNVQTGAVLPFGPAINYGAGLNPVMQTAITADGRYAAVASSTFNLFRIYDLSTCGTVPTHITGSVSCAYKDLYPFMQLQVSGLKGVARLRFRDDYSLDFYASYISGTATNIAYYNVTAAGQSQGAFQYLGLGDSFASGEGAYQYKAATDTDNNKCHLSERSYPYLMASSLGFNQYESVACSGAVIEDVISQSTNYGGQTKQKVPFQDIPNLDDIMASLESGHIAQFRFVENYKPEAITISAAGNDIGFVDKIKRCLEPDTCYASYEDRLELVREINAQFDRVVSMYNKLKSTGNPRAKIYVIGYPQLAKADGNCGNNVHFNNQEIIFSNQLVSYLNTVIKAAAAKAGAQYVDVEHAFDGHRLCETVYSDIAVNGLTAGNDTINILNTIKGPIGNESYHPNALGHRLLAAAITAATNNLTDPMPTPDPQATYPDENSGLEILSDAPKSNRQLYKTSYDQEPGNDVVVRQGWWQTVITSAETALLKAAPVTVFLNSDPVHLGDSVVDDTGQATISVQIPADTAPGFHEVHIYTKSVTGQPIDFYRSIYVAASETDYDGDGVPNSQDPCPTVAQAGQDTDLDGTDDACDGDIGLPPAPPTVAITSPANAATVSGSIVIMASAEDAQGVAGVQFKLDGNDLGTEDTTMPYEYNLDTTALANGNHTLTAVARNMQGQTSSASANVNVQNAAPQSADPLARLVRAIVAIVIRIVRAVFAIFRW